MRLTMFNRPRVGVKPDLPSLVAGLVTLVCVVFNIPLQF